jgi:divalent metal cation (Fe/Co/Zn/Cd) transporter
VHRELLKGEFELEKSSAISGHRENVRAAILVEWITVLWMIIEVLVSISAAVFVGSVALMAFGLDSAIELVSAGVLIWRLGVERRGGSEEQTERAERRAAGIVGWSLVLLAVYVVLSAGWGLWHHAAPESTAWGIAIAAAALVVMPTLVVVKRRIAKRIGSQALKADAAEGVVCAYMAGVLLAGLILRSAFGWWWADPVAALGIVYFIVREGREAIEASRGIDDDE